MINAKMTHPGIPVPGDNLSDNHICLSLEELASHSGTSEEETLEEVDRDNAAGRTYLSVFSRKNDGVVMVAGYVFCEPPARARTL